MTSVYVCGDIHGRVDIEKISKWNTNPKENKVLIVCGDWGGLWYDRGNIEKWKKDQEHLTKAIKLSKSKNFQWVICPGNHENWDMITALPIVEKYGGKMYKLNVYHYFHKELIGEIHIMIRGEVYNIEGKTFWNFGGALSNDKSSRTTGIDHWDKELASWGEYEHGMNTLDDKNWVVDYVITHTCPVNIIGSVIHKTPYTEGKFKDPTAEYLFEIYKKISFKEWHFGHLHTDVKLDYSDSNDGIFYCHYNNHPHKLF